MAPVLSFTAEELWQHFNGNGSQAADDSVFFQTLYPLPSVADAAALTGKWARLRELRTPVRKEIEDLRAAGKVGSSLQTEVELEAPAADHDLLASLGDELKFLMMTSGARVRKEHELKAAVTASTHPKCERCWHYRADVNGEGLCARCRSNLKGPGETRRYV
jgi:isoleucyl-tRNA synthetase